ncbi:MAG: hypothetical protein ACM3US_14520 [Sphingomonadaceae bacterium]
MSTTLRYQLAIRRERFWLPGGLAGLFGAIVAILGDNPNQVQAAVGFLAFVLPLAGGILAASAFVEDPALELLFAAPRAPWLALAECTAAIVAIIAAGSLAFQAWLAALGVDIAEYGSLLTRQLIWLAPTVALVALASITATLTAQGTLGALTVGSVWLFQVLGHGWLASGEIGRKLLIFIGSIDPRAADLWLSYACLFALSAVLLVLSGWALRQTERYL